MKKMTWAGGVAAGVVLLAVSAKASNWETDYSQASKDAAQSGAYVLLDFSGSDWCGWCMKLEDEVFDKKAFKNYAKEKLICVLVDFPRKKSQKKKIKEQNAELAKKYAVKGYPTVILLSSDGTLVGRTGYREGGPEKYVEHLKTMIEEFEKKTPKEPKRPADPAGPQNQD